MTGQDIPRDLQYVAIQSILDQMKARHAKEDEILNHLKQIEDEYRKELDNFLGPKSKEYKAFYEKRGEVARSMHPQFKPTTEGMKKEFEFNEKMISEATEFRKKLGINAGDLKSIRKKYQEQFKLAADQAAEVSNSKQGGQ